MERVYIGLGSNLAEPLRQLQAALAAIAELPHSQLVTTSSFYASDPLGPPDQPRYVNAVAALDTELAPLELLDALQRIEQEQGRVRKAERWGPRTLDLDILLFGNRLMSEERLLAQGAAALSDAELLALFLRVGIRGKSAVDLARDLLTHFGNLSTLCNASASAFAAIPGMGLAKYAQLQAVLELARRALGEEMAHRDVLDSPATVRNWLRLKLAQLPHEVFMILLLDAQNRVMGCEELFRGTLAQTSVYPREVVKLVLERNAAAVILAHNHPSGVGEPSHADQALTDTLKKALALVDVRVLDHFIVAGNAPPVSFAERGLL